jgi:hypothetical protein
VKDGALPLKHPVINYIQIQLNTLKHVFERYLSKASIVLTDLIRYENNILKDENKVLNE